MLSVCYICHFTIWSQSGLTMLSRHSVRTYQGNEITHTSSGNTRTQLSQLTKPLRIVPGLNCRTGVHELISTRGRTLIILHSKISPFLPRSMPGDTVSVTVSICPLCCTWFSSSKSEHLVWLPWDQWHRRYKIHKDSMKFWAFIVTLTLKTTI